MSTRIYGKPVGAGDGCGTKVVDVGALCRRIADLEAEIDELRIKLESAENELAFERHAQHRRVQRGL